MCERNQYYPRRLLCFSLFSLVLSFIVCKRLNGLSKILVVIVVVVVFVEYICLAINSVLTLICCSTHN